MSVVLTANDFVRRFDDSEFSCFIFSAHRMGKVG